MSYQAQQRHLARMQREDVRASRLRQKELEQKQKEGFKLSALQRARLEVDAHENQLEVLLSLHKEVRAVFDWIGTRAALPPPNPPLAGKHQFLAQVQEVFEPVTGRRPDHSEASAKDRADEENAHLELSQDTAEIEQMRKLAEKILSGNTAA